MAYKSKAVRRAIYMNILELLERRQLRSLSAAHLLCPAIYYDTGYDINRFPELFAQKPVGKETYERWWPRYDYESRKDALIRAYMLTFF